MAGRVEPWALVVSRDALTDTHIWASLISQPREVAREDDPSHRSSTSQEAKWSNLTKLCAQILILTQQMRRYDKVLSRTLYGDGASNPELSTMAAISGPGNWNLRVNWCNQWAEFSAILPRTGVIYFSPRHSTTASAQHQWSASLQSAMIPGDTFL